jgi:serum/glucocorticoid-regulated kinase 2
LLGVQGWRRFIFFENFKNDNEKNNLIERVLCYNKGIERQNDLIEIPNYFKFLDEQNLSNPFMLNLKNYYKTDQNIYFLYDYLPFGDLSYHLRIENKFDLEKAKFYLSELVMAIGIFHKKDLIYKDLRTENILIDEEGHIRITENTRDYNQNNNNTYHNFSSSVEYLSPEVIKGKGYSKLVDWWSLGVIFYELLVGMPPFYSQNINEMYELILKGNIKYPDYVPYSAQKLINGLLERQEDKRLGSENDYLDLIYHEFFKDVNWERVYNKKINPPFIPIISEYNKINEIEENEEIEIKNKFNNEKIENKIKDIIYTNEFFKNISYCGYLKKYSTTRNKFLSKKNF